MRPIGKAAFRLMHEGAQALAWVESNGMKVDEPYLETAIDSVSRQIRDTQAELKKSDVYQLWRRTYRDKTNLGSRVQLAHVMFDLLKYPCSQTTATGRPKTDVTALEGVDHPFVKDYVWCEKLKKARATYLRGIQRETDAGFLHPSFNLHLTRTGRSSSDSPNFQNLPVRDPIIGELIRKAFVSRPNHQIVEIDYSAIEVRIAACHTEDPVLIDYICDPTKDMHRDMASQCYLCEPEQVSKMMRYCAKNRFVFPTFYGSMYTDCARALWDSISQMQLEIEGQSLLKWLRAHKITKLGKCDLKERPLRGTFEKHIKEVEGDFWDRRFKVYRDWKRDWYSRYERTGGFTMLSGFRCDGVYRRNEVLNYPIQGSAFHCLLWSLIRIVKYIRKHKMRTKVVGQIHDSIVSDVHKRELDDYLHISRWIMTDCLRKAWAWIIVPLDVEAEVAPVKGSWFDKKEHVF